MYLGCLNTILECKIFCNTHTLRERLQKGQHSICISWLFLENLVLFDNGNFSALRGLDVRDDKPWEIGEYAGIMALDEDWTPWNQMLKYLKYGFGRTTDYVNEDLRRGRLTRDEAISLLNYMMVNVRMNTSKVSVIL